MNHRAVSGAIIGAGVGYRRGAAVGAATGAVVGSHRRHWRGHYWWRAMSRNGLPAGCISTAIPVRRRCSAAAAAAGS